MPFETAIRTKSTEYTKLNESFELIRNGGWITLAKGFEQNHAASMIMPNLSY